MAAATCARRASTLAALDQRGAVGDGASGSGRRAAAPETRRRRAARVGASAARAPPARGRRVEEGAPLEQVARADSRPARAPEICQLGALRFGRGRGLEHEPAVAVEVADGRVDLSERDLHGEFYPQRTPRAGRRGADRVIKFWLCPSGPPRGLRDTPVPTTSRDLIASATQPLDIPRSHRVYVNRNLRLDKIEMVGFDMDYTLALYNQARIEELSMRATLHKLVTAKGYPAAIQGARLRPDAGGARAGRRPRQRQHLQARPLRLPGPRAPRAFGDRSRAGRRAVPARAHAAVEPALRLDRLAVRAARGGAVRLPGRLLRPRATRPPSPTTRRSGSTSASASTSRTATDRSRRSSASSCPTTSSATRRWRTRCTSSARRASGCSCSRTRRGTTRRR